MKTRWLVLSVLLWLAAIVCVLAQPNTAYDHAWCIADRIGLQFEAGADKPQFFTCRLQTEPFYDAECHASIADAAGNLLFYLEARRPPALASTIRNGLHQVMPGGESIEAMGSIANGAVILPRPGQATLYDLFTLSLLNRGTSDERVVLFRHVIDLSDGMGRVVEANRLVTDEPLVDKLAAVRHANGRDWWLVAHGYRNSEFIVYLLEATGNLRVQRQAIGKAHTGHNVRSGEMTFAPTGERLGLVTGNGIVEIFRFDRCTGRFSDPIYLGVDTPPTSIPQGDFVAHYGCSFSPSGRFFYYSTIDRLYQVDLEAADPSRTREKIWEDPVTFANTLAQHELAPDGRIYIARYNHKYLSAIEFPDRKGKNCRFVRDFLYLGGKQLKAGLPNFPNYRLGNWIEAYAGRDTTLCPGMAVRLGAPSKPGLRYRWQPPDELDDPATAQPLARPTIGRTYTLTVEAGSKSGCAVAPAVARVRVDVRPAAAVECRQTLAPPPTSLRQLTLYPNPASDFVFLFYEFESPERVLVEIYDALGQRRHEALLTQAAGRLDYDTTDWPAGLYFFTFRTAGRLFATAQLLVF